MEALGTLASEIQYLWEQGYSFQGIMNQFAGDDRVTEEYARKAIRNAEIDRYGYASDDEL